MHFETRDPSTPNGYNTGFYPGGVYRYSKPFVAPQEWAGRRVSLEFEGVYRHSEVYLNGQLVGGRPSGYAIFEVDLSRRLIYGEENLLEVLARNDQMPNSRWYSGSGIYRPVNLLVGDPIHITANGLRFTTVAASAESATVEVATEITNDTDRSATIRISTTLTDPTGKLLGPFVAIAHVNPGHTGTVHQPVLVISPHLWSTDTPKLYDGVVRIRSNEMVDEARDRFGIRTITVDSEHGLRVNGQSVKLRGGAIHHDSGVIGAHTLDAFETRRVRILKENGFNAIRSAHNPMSRATLRACDEQGMLVMDELSDVWWAPKSAFDYSADFAEWWELDLESLLASGYNHPSIVMYSIGNEIFEIGSARGIDLNQAMANRVRELDPSRFVTNSINGFMTLITPVRNDEHAEERAMGATADPPKPNNVALLNLLMGLAQRAMPVLLRLPTVDKRTRTAFGALDISGYNYMGARYKLDAKRHPTRVIVGSETRPMDTVSRWREIEQMPHVIGDFMWTAWDYIGEAGLGVITYGQSRQLFLPYPALLAGQPIIDILGFPQTQAYVNQIAWGQRTDPYIAIQPVNHVGEKQSPNAWRATNSIRSWSWAGFEGRSATVEVYANAASVELLLDGKSHGRKQPKQAKGYLAEFVLPYQPGTLEAVAYDVKGGVVGRDTLSSSTGCVSLDARSESPTLFADGADLAFITITLVGSNGICLPLADRTVSVHVEGSGTLLGMGSAQPVTTEGFAIDQHSTYQGRALAVIRAGSTPGKILVTVSADECDPVHLSIPVKRPDQRVFARTSAQPKNLGAGT